MDKEQVTKELHEECDKLKELVASDKTPEQKIEEAIYIAHRIFLLGHSNALIDRLLEDKFNDEIRKRLTPIAPNEPGKYPQPVYPYPFQPCPFSPYPVNPYPPVGPYPGPFYVGDPIPPVPTTVCKADEPEKK